jgi:hypothetical protein
MHPDMPDKQEKDIRSLILASLLVIALLFCANYRLVLGRALPQWDAVDQFGPAFSLISDHIKAHRLLTWDPWISAGSPDLADPQFGVSSPIVLVIGFLAPDTQAGFVTYWLLIWVAARWGC